MLKGYLLLVCQSASVDVNSGAPSFFNLVERVTIVPYQPEHPVALETHAYFEVSAEDVGQVIETRLVWQSANGSTWRSGRTVPIKPIVGKVPVRIRVQTLALPPTPGDYHIFVEGRRAEDTPWECISPAIPLSLLTEADQPLPSQTSA